MTFEIIIFILVVGIGSTLTLDLWGMIAAKIGWMPGTHWPSVGRWLLGLPKGRPILDGEDARPNTTAEGIVGWVFHYLVGLAYAAMFPLFWGPSFVAEPTIFPFILIGVIVSTLAGLVILMPGMGGGIFARKLPNSGGMILYVLLAHMIFATAQYFLAVVLA